MTDHPFHILAIAGSLRTQSFNRKALQIAKKIASGFSNDIREIDLKTLALPVFDEDLRANGFPESVVTLKQAIESSDILFIATPEYNHSIPGPLKNAIDWASDKTNPFSGKTAAIFGASNGLNGTIRSQIHLRQVLAALNVEVVPQPQVFIRSAREAFLPDGSFADASTTKNLKLLVEETFKLAQRKRDTREV
jgi:chromate reductase, NAD(P)H dehydrogenase (quinone)